MAFDAPLHQSCCCYQNVPLPMLIFCQGFLRGQAGWVQPKADSEILMRQTTCKLSVRIQIRRFMRWQSYVVIVGCRQALAMFYLVNEVCPCACTCMPSACSLAANLSGGP